MKLILIAAISFFVAGCGQQAPNNFLLQNRIDSLEHKFAISYKPGFGEFMSAIQAHHAKLWFAGKNKNWKLADFELKEIMESIDDIKLYETDRKETKSISIIEPVLQNVAAAVTNENEALFEQNFTSLTNTCNNCHTENNFEFNVVKIPEMQTFSNQDFKPAK